MIVGCARRRPARRRRACRRAARCSTSHARERATVVVLSRAAQSDDDVVMQASMLHEEGVRVRTLSLFYEQWLGKLPIGELERVSLLFDIGEVHQARYARVEAPARRRARAASGSSRWSCVTPFVALGNLFANRGPLFYRQPRVGRNGDRRSRS